MTELVTSYFSFLTVTVNYFNFRLQELQNLVWWCTVYNLLLFLLASIPFCTASWVKCLQSFPPDSNILSLQVSHQLLPLILKCFSTWMIPLVLGYSTDLFLYISVLRSLSVSLLDPFSLHGQTTVFLF